MQSCRKLFNALMDPALLLWIQQNFSHWLSPSHTYKSSTDSRKWLWQNCWKSCCFGMLQPLNAELRITSTVITHEDLLVSKLFSDYYLFKWGFFFLDIIPLGVVMTEFVILEVFYITFFLLNWAHNHLTAWHWPNARGAVRTMSHIVSHHKELDCQSICIH